MRTLSSRALVLSIFALVLAAGTAAACGDEVSTAEAAPTSPTPEAGQLPLDDGGGGGTRDADSTDGAGAPVASWSRRFGEASAKEIEGAKAVATDLAGNVIIVGEIWGAANFGGGVLATAGGQDIFVAKLDPNGNHLWSKRFGDVSDGQTARSIAVDKTGAVLVAGEFAGVVDFGGGALTATGGADAFLAKLDASGEHLWSHRYGGAGKTTAASIKTDGSNNVVAVGDFAFTVDFSGGSDAGVDASTLADGGAGSVLTSLGGQDAFVIKLGADGKLLWGKRLGGSAKRQSGDGVAIDSAGNLLVASTFEGTVNFGGSDLIDLGYPTFGASNVAVTKLTPSGDHIWSKGFGDAARQYIRAIAVDRAGNALLAGQFTGTINFGGADLTSSAKPLFLVKLDPNGGQMWSKSFGTVGTVDTGGVTTDATNSVIFAGRFSGKVDFGGNPFATADSDYDAVLAKLPPSP